MIYTGSLYFLVAETENQRKNLREMEGEEGLWWVVHAGNL